MTQDIEVTQEFIFAEVYRDLAWFSTEYERCPSVKFEEDGLGIPADLMGRQFVFETRVGIDNKTEETIIAIMIYEIKVEGEEGIHFCTISRYLERVSDDPEASFADERDVLQISSVETLLLVAQSSVIRFRDEIEKPKVLH